MNVPSSILPDDADAAQNYIGILPRPVVMRHNMPMCLQLKLMRFVIRSFHDSQTS
jgi:hypothetical protein